MPPALKLVFISSVLATSLVSSASSPNASSNWAPPSLLAAIETGIRLNPKTKSKDLTVESLHDLTLMAESAKYPSGSISCSYGYYNSPITYAGYPTINDQYRNATCGISISETLYDGGSSEYKYEAAKETEEATQEEFNSTEVLTQNTKGKLANDIEKTYLTLQGDILGISRAQYELQFLPKLLDLATTDADRNRIINQIAGVQQSLNKSQSDATLQIANFSHDVTLSPPPQMDDYETTIQSLVIPATPAAAETIALAQNPDILATNSALAAAELNYKAAEAALGPHVSLVGSYSYINNPDTVIMGDSFRERSGYVGIQFSIPLSFGLSHYADSEEHAEQAAELDQKSALEDAKFQIETNYVQLTGAQSLHDLAQKNYLAAQATLDKYLNQILNRDPAAPQMKDLLDALTATDNFYSTFISQQVQVIIFKFTILQATGTLLQFQSVP